MIWYDEHLVRALQQRRMADGKARRPATKRAVLVPSPAPAPLRPAVAR